MPTKTLASVCTVYNWTAARLLRHVFRLSKEMTNVIKDELDQLKEKFAQNTQIFLARSDPDPVQKSRIRLGQKVSGPTESGSATLDRYGGKKVPYLLMEMGWGGLFTDWCVIVYHCLEITIVYLCTTKNRIE
jgi:hypothetical protein